ncbi:hypothetical protein [Bacillus pumilus]|uniref:hypothetical protein n=1 Tax=Bacillus pumilus TaxID=1408 RepID=UPI0024905627|nr:hypothetical protein [Bacillus pumilus]
MDNDKTKKKNFRNREKTQKLLPEANKLVKNGNISVCITSMANHNDLNDTLIQALIHSLYPKVIDKYKKVLYHSQLFW